MAKFLVKFKRESGNKGTKQYVPVGFEVEVNSNSSSTPFDVEVKKAVEEKLSTNFNYSCSSGLWEAKKI
jgi:hypothetical protein